MREHGRRRRLIVACTASVASVLVSAGIAGSALTGDSTALRPTAVRVLPVIGLPDPRTDGATSFEQAVVQRGAVREFDSEPLTLAQLGQLLWAAQGEHRGGRTVPSAGALYPLEVYVATADGV
jgi:hypothetical protein